MGFNSGFKGLTYLMVLLHQKMPYVGA